MISLFISNPLIMDNYNISISSYSECCSAVTLSNLLDAQKVLDKEKVFQAIRFKSAQMPHCST
jgi:cysteine sulfinate desulfinase/cysteine desulfurase-like protein